MLAADEACIAWVMAFGRGAPGLMVVTVLMVISSGQFEGQGDGCIGCKASSGFGTLLARVHMPRLLLVWSTCDAAVPVIPPA